MKIFDLPLRLQIWFVLIIGVFGISTGAIFIRLALAVPEARGIGFSFLLSAFRLSVAALMLLPALRSIQIRKLEKKAWYYASAAGICLAIHFATWITSLSFTSITASATLVTTNPVWVALLSWLWFKEKPTPMTVFGISIALLGGILIASGDTKSISIGSNPLLGNTLALVGGIMYSLYLLLGREAQRHGLGVGGYVVIAYSTGALVLLPLPMLFGSPYIGYPLEIYLYIFLMAILSQVIGHTSLNWAMRWISSTFVSLAVLFEPVGSSLLGYIIFQEVPGFMVLGGAAVLLVGVALAIFGARSPSLSQ